MRAAGNPEVTLGGCQSDRLTTYVIESRMGAAWKLADGLEAWQIDVKKADQMTAGEWGAVATFVGLPAKLDYKVKTLAIVLLAAREYTKRRPIR